MVSEQAAQTIILKGHGASSALHFKSCLNPALFVLLQPPLYVLEEFPFAGPGLALIIAKADLDCRRFVLRSNKTMRQQGLEGA